MRKNRLLLTSAIVALSATLASAELVGSLHLNTNDDTNGVDRLAGFRTRTGNGNANTRGTVEGSFSLRTGRDLGDGSFPGAQIDTYSGNTRIQRLNRYGGANGGIAVWDFDVSGLVTNAWELKVDYTSRRSNCLASEWYVSFNGLGRTLDTTVVTNLESNTSSSDNSCGALVGDPSKYIKIGELPANTDAGIYTWDLTEIVNAAATNGGGIRLVYFDNTYQDTGPNFFNDSGLIATNTTSATPVEIPSFIVMDDFETGTASATNGLLINGWSGDGPEMKEYNVGSSGLLAIRDEYSAATDLQEGTNGVVNKGNFDTVQVSFDNIALANDGDWLEVSADLAFSADTANPGAWTNCTSPMANMTIVDSSLSSNAGYGYRINGNSNYRYHQLRTFDYDVAFGTDISAPNTSRTFVLEDTMQTWYLRIERAGTNFVLTSKLDGVLFNNIGVFTNNTCIDAVFDLLTFTVRGNDIQMEIDNVTVLSNVEPVGGYDLWSLGFWAFGDPDADAGANPDGDVLDNWGEYVFDGNPTNPADIGIQPAFDGATGGYVYTLRNDDALVPYVLTTEDLVVGNWTTNPAAPVTENDGGITEYTNAVGTAADETFIKLLVE